MTLISLIYFLEEPFFIGNFMKWFFSSISIINGKFIIIEQLRNVRTSPTEKLKLRRLRKRIFG